MGPSEEMRHFGRRSTAAKMLETGGKVVTPGCTRLKSVPAREPEDHKCSKGQKSNNGTRFKNSQSCVRLVV